MLVLPSLTMSPRSAERENISAKIFQWICLLMGLRIEARDDRFEKYYAYVCVATYPFLLVPQFLPVLTLKLFYHKMIVFVFFFSTMNIVAMSVWIHRQRDVVVAVFASIIRKDDDALFDEERARYLDATVKSKMKKILFSLLVIASLVYSTPLFIKFSSSLSGPVDPIFMFIIPAWYPWSMDTSVSYSLTMLIQVVSDFIPALTALGHVLCIQYFHALFQTMRLAIIAKIDAVDRVGARSGTSYGVEDVDLDRECASILHDVVRSYSLLLKTMNTCVVMMKVYIFMATWTFFAAGAVLTILQQLQPDADFLVSTTRTISFQILFGANLIFCIQTSQCCYEINDDIRAALYQTKWYRRSTRFRKTMIIFMILLQRSYTVRALGVSTYILLWSFITKMTKFTYSVLRVFLTIR